MGYPEMVVNSVWRSGLFSRVGRSVFSSQARSFAEGSREVAGASPVVMVEAVPLTLSLMACRSPWCAFRCVLQKNTGFHAMRKRNAGQEDEAWGSVPICSAVAHAAVTVPGENG